jgi:5,10-methylenetetrahydromethanopterin reductase
MVREGAARVDRQLDDDFDFCASILGAIAQDGDAARAGAGVAAAFYFSSMAPELVERHGIAFADVQPVVEAFARGDVSGALALAPADTGTRFALAGTPEEWVDRIRTDFIPQGYNHMALVLADPYLVQQWTGRSAEGLPSLAEQLHLIHEHVLPAFR